MLAAGLRRRDADRRPDGDPRKAPREVAFDRLAELLEAGYSQAEVAHAVIW